MSRINQALPGWSALLLFVGVSLFGSNGFSILSPAAAQDEPVKAAAKAQAAAQKAKLADDRIRRAMGEVEQVQRLAIQQQLQFEVQARMRVLGDVDAPRPSIEQLVFGRNNGVEV